MKEDFKDGWAVNRRQTRIAHWFRPSVKGTVVSLCRLVRERPATVHTGFDTKTRQCHVCLAIMLRSGTRDPMSLHLTEPPGWLSPAEVVEILTRRFSPHIADFLASPDPRRGPRLYVCPVCRQAFEGRSEKPYVCSGDLGQSHKPTQVVELARKDP